MWGKAAVACGLSLLLLGRAPASHQSSVPARRERHQQPKQAPAFDVVVDEQFDRPFWRRTPPSDSNKEKPLDVVKRFLESTGSGDAGAAWDCCRSSRDGLGPFPSIGKELFPTFCDKMRHYVKRVTLSGSTIKGKSGYWFIRYRLKATDGQERQGTFYLIIDDKVWKIEEKSHWRKIATGDYRGVPGW